MKNQKIFKFNFNTSYDLNNFYVNNTNKDAYNGVININNKNIFLIGPKKSGKSYLANIWLKNNKALKFNNNIDLILNNNHNVLIENIDINFKDEEKIFHIINHCLLNNINILITSSNELDQINFFLKDLISRIKTFTHLKILQPDDDMLINILTKLFVERQFIINSQEIFQYIVKNANRSYIDMYNIVKKLDKLSLEKKRQLTIPLIKEIL